MDANQIEKLKLTFGPDKVGACTVVLDKKEKTYHLLEITKSGTYLKDKAPILETSGNYEVNAEEYNYCITNWQKIFVYY